METNEGTWLEVDSFTQKDINASKIAYEHKNKIPNLSANDSFVFDIETSFASSLFNQVSSETIKLKKLHIFRLLVKLLETIQVLAILFKFDQNRRFGMY